MLNAANVLIDGHPAVNLSGIKRFFRVVWIGITHVVPRRARKSIHRVSFAVSRLTAFRTRCFRKAFMRCQSFPRCKVNIFRKHNGKIFFRNGNQTAIIAINSRNRIAPITLARNKPIAQTELNGFTTATLSFKISNDGIYRWRVLAAYEARVFSRLNQNTFIGISSIPINRINLSFLNAIEFREQRVILVQDDRNDRQIILTCKFEVALVTARNRHYRTSTVIAHDVVGNPNRNLVAIDRVNHIAARESTMLFTIALRAFNRTYFCGRFYEGVHCLFIFRTLNELLNQGAFRCKQEKATTKERIGARGKNRNNVVFCRVFWSVSLLVTKNEIYFSTLRATNPVCLHLLNAFRPAIELIKIIQKLLSVIGDFEIPLRKITLFNGTVATPTLTFGNLFVGQNRSAIGAPIYRRIATLN